ncbi:MAG: acetyl-CoA carboxylase biotin carboxylase subunit [Acidimicrobiia bacterium]|nr:acetyl-CoA carboxylase biotin carboxylase subunit [Acidimicrobiia bacterium]
MEKILIANRGEIAVRVIRACRDLGLAAVAVYSECDRRAKHVRLADEAYAIGPNPPGDSYLHIGRLIDAARRAGADAVHPGYGFLSENEAFAAACRDAGLVFIGPTPEVIARMGSKTAARAAALAAGAPVVPGTDEALGPDVPDARIAALAETIGYPLMVKAVAGGGGRGLRVVSTPAELPGALRAARSEAGTAFGDSSIFLERRIDRARHVEVQLLGDTRGTVVPFVERECSLQRRHQKVLEESPSPVVPPGTRARLTEAAANIAREVGYTGAGTAEFLFDDADGRFYFLEMNARLQVEHPITEMVTGVDLVAWQIRIARGEALTLDAAAMLRPNGHAIECRIIAEDPDSGFMPSPGRIEALQTPGGAGIRDDSGVEVGSDVPIFYDPMLAKLIAWGTSREHAVARMRRALGEYEIVGVRTSVPFFRWLLDQPDFLNARFDTTYLDRLLRERGGDPFLPPRETDEEVAAVAAALHATLYASRQSDNPAPAPGGWRQHARTGALRP